MACFANAAAHLEPGGSFVIKVVVSDLRRLPPGEDARVLSHAPGYVGYDRYTDLVSQQATSHHFVADGRRGDSAVTHATADLGLPARRWTARSAAAASGVIPAPAASRSTARVVSWMPATRRDTRCSS